MNIHFSQHLLPDLVAEMGLETRGADQLGGDRNDPPRT
jgi:hypothetical protein